MLTHLSLFSGIGGIDKAAEWAGFETIGQCEWADYPTKVLEKHWPNVSRWRDIRDVTADSVSERTGHRAIDLISGGYPCQPFSFSGHRKGQEDDRYLWPEMFRIIAEIRPTWVLGENVAGHVTLGLDSTLSDLESIGYSCRSVIIPAAAVGVNHERNRVFIVAYSHCDRCKRIKYSRAPRADREERTEQPTRFPALQDWNDISARYIGRKNDGIPRRMDRLKCLGNAVVPQQIYPILKGIADIERGL